MKNFLLAICLPVLAAPLMVGQAATGSGWMYAVPDQVGWSSSNVGAVAEESFEAARMADDPWGVGGIPGPPAVKVERRASNAPFSSVGVEFQVGVGGIGLELATPLGPRINLRVGGSYFEYHLNTTADSIHYTGDLQLRRASLGFDLYPFSARFRESFRITPGVTVYNGNQGRAAASVAGGKNFQLNDQGYVSDLTDPIHGSAAIDFGKNVAPSLTIGFGNLVPRNGGHWSVPFEVGFEYVGHVGVALDLAGSACTDQGCGPVKSDPTTVSNLIGEQQQLADDLDRLRFYPIFSIGLAYRFGRTERR